MNVYNWKTQLAWLILMIIVIILGSMFLTLLVCSLTCEDAYAMDGDDPYWDFAYWNLGFDYGVLSKEILNQNYQQGIIQAAVISAFKEIGDQMYSEGMFGKPDSDHWLMDARGGDPMDIFWCVLGSACVPMVYEFRGWMISVGWLSPATACGYCHCR